MLVAVLWEPKGRMFVRAVGFAAVDPVLVLPVGQIDRDAAVVNAAVTDPEGAGEFLQDKLDDGELFRYFGYDQSYYHGGWGWPSTYREYFYDPVVQDLLVNARAMRLGHYDVQGYNPVQLSDYVLTLDVVNGEQQNYHDAQILEGGITSPLLDMLNVRYIVIPNMIATGRPRPDLMKMIATYPEVFRNDTIRVLENTDALPRAWIVHDVVEATKEYGLVMIGQGIIDPRKSAFLEPGSEAPPLAQPTNGLAEQVIVKDYRADEITLSVTMATDGMVILSEVYANGWVAYIDGEKAPIHQANGVLRAVGVPAGMHQVAIRYEPASLRLGLYLSGVTAGLITIVYVALGLIQLINRIPENWSNRNVSE